jgi:hypothetical protein
MKVLAVIVVLLALCVPSATAGPSTLPFEPISRGIWAKTALSSTPRVHVASRAEHTRVYEDALDETGRSRLQEIAYPAELVVGVFLQCPTTGYSVTIERLEVRRGALRVVVDLRRPRDGALFMVTYPYDLVRIARTDLRRALGRDTHLRSWVLVQQNGRVLATKTGLRRPCSAR